ncbi:hypothetical protein OXYTRIMIC_184 [Oxytricha trifallax]|uniref:Uncharacterized protein n=1 Tax=Oxytricha trifallax TaxID=1172189 RepID=A0A073IBQ6_9SPIT|nr:hypothetical protein OXYTRIMIC_184 [Oxytricha trifallax]
MNTKVINITEERYFHPFLKRCKTQTAHQFHINKKPIASQKVQCGSIGEQVFVDIKNNAGKKGIMK